MNRQFILAPKSQELIQLGSETVDKDYLADELIFRLEEAGLKPYVYYESNSLYIKFNPPQEFLGSLRVADHGGRKQYKYRWNLRFDFNHYEGVPAKWGGLRHFYPSTDLDKMVEHMHNYVAKVVNSTEDFSKLAG